MMYFAYGSNLHLEQMMMRCPDAEPVTQGLVRGYKLVYRRGVATIERGNHKDKVYGAVYKISKRDLMALDRYEGYPTLYIRKEFKIETREGHMGAMVYIMHTHYEMSPPRPGYYDIIEEGFRNWGLPLENLKSTLHRIDFKPLKI